MTAATNCWCISTDHTTRCFLAVVASSLSLRCSTVKTIHIRQSFPGKGSTVGTTHSRQSFSGKGNTVGTSHSRQSFSGRYRTAGKDHSRQRASLADTGQCTSGNAWHPLLSNPHLFPLLVPLLAIVCPLFIALFGWLQLLCPAKSFPSGMDRYRLQGPYVLIDSVSTSCQGCLPKRMLPQ